jgi:hypothetical protein
MCMFLKLNKDKSSIGHSIELGREPFSRFI